jgi:hypothetical protein
MRYLMLGVVLLFSTSGVTRADGGLTDAVATAFLLRTVDAQLHDIAHARATEVAAAGSLNHDGMRPGTAEVLAWNKGEAYPIASAVSAWIGSPLHNGILSNRSYGRIGCASVVRNGTHWFACVLVAGPLPAQPASTSGTTTVAALPDTSMPSDGQAGVAMTPPVVWYDRWHGEDDGLPAR